MNKEIKEFLEGLKGKRVAFVGMGVANVPCAKWLAENGVSVYASVKKFAGNLKRLVFIFL